MQIPFLERKSPSPNTFENYKKLIFSFDSKEIHPIDHIDLHKQAEEMIYSNLTISAMEKYKL